MVRTDSRRYRQVTHTPTHTHTDNGSFLVETYSTRQQKPSGTKNSSKQNISGLYNQWKRSETHEDTIQTTFCADRQGPTPYRYPFPLPLNPSPRSVFKPLVWLEAFLTAPPPKKKKNPNRQWQQFGDGMRWVNVRTNLRLHWGVGMS